MFTIEHEFDETIITVLNEFGGEDVSVLMIDEAVYIRQWDRKRQAFDVIVMTPQMYHKLMKSYTLPEGTYTLEVENANTK